LKGFTKDGKFRPTGRTKSGLSKKTLQTKENSRTVELKGAEAEDYIKKRFPNYDIKKLPKELRGKESMDEDELGNEFNKIITVDSGYGKVYGDNDEFYEVGVEDGFDAEELDEIKEDIGYEIDSVRPANDYFVQVVFKKIGDKK